MEGFAQALGKLEVLKNLWTVLDINRSNISSYEHNKGIAKVYSGECHEQTCGISVCI